MLDEVLTFLSDLKAHSFHEVLDYVRCHCRVPIPSERKLEAVLKFLEEFGFVKVTGRRIRLNSKVARQIRSLRS